MFTRGRRSARLGRYVKLPWRVRVTFVLIFLVLSMGLSYWVIERGVAPVIWAVAEMETDIRCSQILYEVIHEEIVPDIRYSDLVIIERTEAGQVSMMQLNTGKVGDLETRAGLAVQRRLAELGVISFNIPFGQITGSNLFASRGPMIPVRLLPLGVARTSVRDVFESAGINQTRHVIYLETAVDLRVVIPLVERRFRVATSFPIADVIIVGEVPRAYLNVPFNLPTNPAQPAR